MTLLCAAAAVAQFIVEREGEYYHRMSCPLLREMKIEDMLIVRSFEAAVRYDKQPCPRCKPPVSEAKRKVITLRPHINLIADLKERVYHKQTCKKAADIKEPRRRAISSYDEAVRFRCRPCKECQPPSLRELKEMEPEELEEESDAQVPVMRVRARRIVSQLVTVPAGKERVDTGIEVEKGQLVLFRARGMIQTSKQLDPEKPPPVTGPGGAIVDGEKKHCLMARIGGQVHEVGRERGIECEKDGTLYLGILDDKDGYADNQGSFQVWIRVFEPVGEPEPTGAEEAKSE